MKALLAVGTATITSCTSNRSAVTIAAAGDYEPGIGRVGFVLIDLGEDAPANVVDREDVDYCTSLPTRVSEEWTSVALIAETPYRVFFHVYDRTGVNLVAYDRRDFTLPAREENVR